MPNRGVSDCSSDYRSDAVESSLIDQSGHHHTLPLASRHQFITPTLPYPPVDRGLAKVDPWFLSTFSTIYRRSMVQFASVTVLHHDSKLVAGIGCSGATDEEDGLCADAARDAGLSGRQLRRLGLSPCTVIRCLCRRRSAPPPYQRDRFFGAPSAIPHTCLALTRLWGSPRGRAPGGKGRSSPSPVSVFRRARLSPITAADRDPHQSLGLTRGVLYSK